MRPHSFIRTLAAAALIAVPSLALAAPDSNTNGNNNCRNGQWINGQCVYNNNGQYNNGQWNNNGRQRHRDRDDDNDRDDRHDNGRHNGNNGNWNNGNNGNWNNGQYNGQYGNNQYNGNGNGSYGRGNQLSGTVSSFSPYNLYLNNGVHVQLHNGTVINPTGTNLTPGMRVRVIGNRNSDGTFNANEIDVIGNGGNRYYR